MMVDWYTIFGSSQAIDLRPIFPVVSSEKKNAEDSDFRVQF